MVTRLVGFTKVVAGGLALAVLLFWVPGSQAAVYTASATDPSGDLGIEAGDELPDPPGGDFTKVTVNYDDVAARVDVSFSFHQAAQPVHRLNAGVGLGSVDANGYCNAPFLHSLHWPLLDPPQGQAVVVGESSGFTGSVTGTVWNSYEGEGWQGAALFDWPGTEKKTWNFATTHPSLVGKRYTCVRVDLAVWSSSGGVGADSSGVLDLKPVVAAAPSARWVSPRDGQTVSGVLTEGAAGAQNCLAQVTGPVVRTENYVDNKLNDTQVFAPWSCHWDTRQFVNGGHLLTVKAYDAANNVIAADTIRVTVNNPNPPPVNSPPPPIVETSPGVVVPSGTTSSQPAKPAPRFTRQKARVAVKRALARRYGNAFRKRKGYVAKCQKTSASRWNCAVRWRYGQFVYKGKIKLTLRPDGRIASQFLLRKTFQ